MNKGSKQPREQVDRANKLSIVNYSRYVVGWSLSNTMTSNWCRKILQEAIEKHGKPKILNTDQASQFTAYEFCDWVTHPDRAIKLSMDGKGRAIDLMCIGTIVAQCQMRTCIVVSS